MGALETVLLAVAASLASGMLKGAAKVGWHQLKRVLISHSTDAGETEQWLARFEDEPSEEGARDLAKRLHERGIDGDVEVQESVGRVGTQIALGRGSVNASIGTNYGTIGGIHVHEDENRPKLEMSRSGSLAYVLTNKSVETLSLVEVEGNTAVSRLEVRGGLPAVLNPGDFASLIVEESIGRGLPLIVVAYTFGHEVRRQKFHLPSWS